MLVLVCFSLWFLHIVRWGVAFGSIIEFLGLVLLCCPAWMRSAG